MRARVYIRLNIWLSNGVISVRRSVWDFSELELKHVCGLSVVTFKNVFRNTFIGLVHECDLNLRLASPDSYINIWKMSEKCLTETETFPTKGF